MKPNFNPEPYRPSRLWLNPHAQTVLANSLRDMNGISYRRVRLDTPDGDFLDLDFATVPGIELGHDTPLVLLLHGLEGSARRSYASETYRQLAQRGVRAVGMNFRSCSGELNRTSKLYHAGKTDDVGFVISWLDNLFPHAAKGLVGFSLGANTLLKYLGEQGEESPIQAAAAVSPPFDLARIARTFHLGSGRPYAARFMKSLRHKALNHAQLNGSGIDTPPYRLGQRPGIRTDAAGAPRQRWSGRRAEPHPFGTHPMGCDPFRRNQRVGVGDRLHGLWQALAGRPARTVS